MPQSPDSPPDSGGFVRATEMFRTELLAHCYRMLGSVDEVEDLVQETYLRAWRSYDGFQGRSSVRVWLYRIATNACLTALERRGRRPLPSGLGAPSEDAEAPLAMAGSDVSWLQPLPDAFVAGGSPDTADPAAVVAARESLRLAVVASLQYLPPRQRAVLILRDVLDLPTSEVGQVLDMSEAAVKSALQRARGRIAEAAPDADQVTEPTEPEQRALLEKYMSAFEQADISGLEKVLRQDAVLEMTPSRTWFSGLVTCTAYLAKVMGRPGDWLMTPTRANGQPAAGAYYRGADGTYRAYGIAVLTVADGAIARITVFGDASLFDAFGLPQTREAEA
ncbi:sigma-70 family RNA polymerase sigma factor [Actinacidiphila sp. DG2A-62]|uniref:sigma-70 family RNA polymerase sigma factor n=1 Tax=Actinacidiphila sp. DG2A-62 TaxID=3108821 RepID=UPI002DBE038C|nr:sigma-70 family RNA polymerase sigma factor [Actinacidiphila sp. DG2A-62]MEC3994869.1 sigma-70 family RNA polymerase sigma factor [Actinacidiphila sp. DG2A-62]